MEQAIDIKNVKIKTNLTKNWFSTIEQSCITTQ